MNCQKAPFTKMLSIINGGALTELQKLPEQSVQCCVTSPPYWGLRDYGIDGQMGLEETPEQYTAKLVEIFREVKRVLRDDGTLWLNLGDSYMTNGESTGMRSKNLVGIPWRIAFALQADGWYLRSDIIWHKPNPMPESVTDRPTKSHEYLFLLAKSERYYYDADAIREPSSAPILMQKRSGIRSSKLETFGLTRDTCNPRCSHPLGSNKRTVWTIPMQPYAEAHFATFPEDLVKPCVMAGTKLGDTVLDPFAGSGPTLRVAIELGRQAIGIELNLDYCKMIEQRCLTTVGML